MAGKIHHAQEIETFLGLEMAILFQLNCPNFTCYYSLCKYDRGILAVFRYRRTENSVARALPVQRHRPRCREHGWLAHVGGATAVAGGRRGEAGGAGEGAELVDQLFTRRCARGAQPADSRRSAPPRRYCLPDTFTSHFKGIVSRDVFGF